MDWFDKLKIDIAGLIFTIINIIKIPFKWFWKLSFWTKFFIIVILLLVFDGIRGFLFKLLVNILLIGK
jgi:hypothetical protein